LTLKSTYNLEFLGLSKPVKELDLERRLVEKIKFRTLIAVDLKVSEFKPEYIGKMNFYLGLLDDQVKQTDENPSIGILLCADKEHVEVEIALRDVNKPIGVADYQLQFPEKEIRELISNEMKKMK